MVAAQSAQKSKTMERSQFCTCIDRPRETTALYTDVLQAAHAAAFPEGTIRAPMARVARVPGAAAGFDLPNHPSLFCRTIHFHLSEQETDAHGYRGGAAG